MSADAEPTMAVKAQTTNNARIAASGAEALDGKRHAKKIR
ncbi:hypothetical protein HNE_2493 [Hyphomonas neptunium ATCC 15444]|uniref:Uncharacterized protein n=1 Tax=Hyphomonas neptunium (strain ATCC 15444) TaxID=228405 RepID=Q0BZA6_HYPNA|nr:hypothetical protein HNE_2493 [Hyphomonas neptunium ATCC 15444]